MKGLKLYKGSDKKVCFEIPRCQAEVNSRQCLNSATRLQFCAAHYKLFRSEKTLEELMKLTAESRIRS